MGDVAQVPYLAKLKNPLAANEKRLRTRFSVWGLYLFFVTKVAPLSAALPAAGLDDPGRDSIPYPCDSTLLQRITEASDSIGGLDLSRLLASPPAASCPTNVEYGEGYNKLLFGVLARYPAAFSRALNDLTLRVQDLILSALTEPVTDGIDLATARMYLAASQVRLDSLIATALALGERTITHECPLTLGDATLVDLSGDSASDTLTVVWQPDDAPQHLQLKRSGQRTDLRTLNPDDNLSWVRRIELAPPGIYAPSLLDAESGDLIGVDVSAAVRLQHDGLRLYPEETEGSLLINVDANGRLRFMYL